MFDVTDINAQNNLGLEKYLMFFCMSLILTNAASI